MIYGYARVSTRTQIGGTSLEDQSEKIRETYPGVNEIISEQYSGAKSRPKFNELLERLSAGDTLVVTKLDRFCRTTKEGLEYIDLLLNKGVKIHILNMGLIENNPIGRLIVTQLLAFAEFERAMITERMQGGRQYKRENDPDYKDGRKEAKVDIELGRKLLAEGLSVSKMCKQLGISRATWYNKVAA